MDDVDLANPESRRAGLEGSLRILATTIAIADPTNIASLVKQYRETLRELDELPAATEVNPIDELTVERDRRRAAVPKSTSGRIKRRTGSD